jgi:hypothetical protein
MTMSTTMPIASRRAFIRLGAATPFQHRRESLRCRGLAAVPAPGRALETRYRSIDVNGLEIFYREAGPAAAPAAQG